MLDVHSKERCFCAADSSGLVWLPNLLLEVICLSIIASVVLFPSTVVGWKRGTCAGIFSRTGGSPAPVGLFAGRTIVSSFLLVLDLSDESELTRYDLYASCLCSFLGGSGDVFVAGT